MPLNQIVELLKKFKSLRPPDESLKLKTIEAIKKEFGIEVLKKNIRIQNGRIHLTGTPALKNEVFLRKDAILEAINDNLEEGRVKDIQ